MWKSIQKFFSFEKHFVSCGIDTCSWVWCTIQQSHKEFYITILNLPSLYDTIWGYAMKTFQHVFFPWSANDKLVSQLVRAWYAWRFSRAIAGNPSYWLHLVLLQTSLHIKHFNLYLRYQNKVTACSNNIWVFQQTPRALLNRFSIASWACKRCLVSASSRWQDRWGAATCLGGDRFI